MVIRIVAGVLFVIVLVRFDSAPPHAGQVARQVVLLSA